MSFESVNVMNKQELGCNPSKTVEHGHDALDSRMSCSPDREEGEVEDGEIDDDDDGKLDNNDSASTIDQSPVKAKPHDDPGSDEDSRNHNSKRHRDRKRRHKKEKRHHHASHKRRRGSPDKEDLPDRRDHSPSMKKSRRNDGEGRRPWDFDRPSPTDEDSGVFGVTSHGNVIGMGNSKNNSSRLSNNHSSNNSRHGHENDDGKRGRVHRHRSNSSRDNDNEKESMGSNPSNPSRDSDSEERMQDLFSDGDDLDLDVAVHERDGAFQRPKEQSRPERVGPRSRKKSKRNPKAREYWHSRMKREEFRHRETERERKRCRFYMEGRCGKADHCPFSHDFSPPKKLELCKFYAISSCLKGEYCVYMHDDFPCKFYHTGSRVCKYEDNCKFSHDQLTRDTKKVLERFMEERESNTVDGNDENSNIIDPFNLGEEEPIEEPDDMNDDRKNSLLGSPPLVAQERGRSRGGFGPDSSPCDPMRGSSPSLQNTQGPSPPPFSGQQNMRPQSAHSPQHSSSNQVNMNQHHRPFGMNSSPGEHVGGPMNNPRGAPARMSGPMPRRPMGPNQGGPMTGMMGPQGPVGPMMMQNRPPPFPGNPRMGPMMNRPPANMLHPRPMMMRSQMGPQNFGMGMRPRGQMGNDMGGYVDPQLDDLASMLVQEKQQGDGQRDDESMLKAAGADDSDLDEEGDTLDAMVHRMRKESEEQQRRQQPPQFPPTSQAPGAMQSQRPPFQQFQPTLNPQSQQQPAHLQQQQQVPPLMPPQQSSNLPPTGSMMMGHPEFGMGMGMRSSYNPQQMFNPPNNMQGPGQAMYMRPPVSSQSMAFPQSNLNSDGGMENGAKELYLRIAKQTATGRQEQLARETERQAKSPAAETPASPPPCEMEPNIGPREWKLIPLDVPLKTPYPLMRLPHDLHYSRSDPRLTGQLRLATSGSTTPTQGKPATSTQPEPPSDTPTTPKMSSVTSSPSSSVEMGGRAYTPSMSNVNVNMGTTATKDPRLGRQMSSPNLTPNANIAPEIPAALLQKPTNDSLSSFKLEIDVDPQPRPPPKMQLSERASSFQSPTDESKQKLNTSTGSLPSLQSPQTETRSYLMDPRFRRRKASVPSGSTGSAPDSDNSVDGSLPTPEKSGLDSVLKKDTTPVPSSGESSPV